MLSCVCACVCVCVLLTTLMCIWVSENDRREREGKVLRTLGEQRCVLSAFEEQMRGIERMKEAELWGREREEHGKRKRECKVL